MRGYALVPVLVCNTGRFVFAKIDIEDVSKVDKGSWLLNAYGYAQRSQSLSEIVSSIGKRMVYMHRLVLGLSGRKVCDHKNGDKLDNRKANLRACTRSQNGMHATKIRSNTPFGVIGVSLHKRTGKYRAYINVGKRLVHLGMFVTVEEAAVARRKAERRYYKGFAPKVGIK